MTVAGNSMELNATNVEVIIGTVIEESNNGKIDLNGFSSFWTFIKQEVNATLGPIENELKPVAPACGGSNRKPKGLTCSTCVCEYRNTIIDKIIIQVEDTLEMSKTESMNMYGTDLAPYIEEFMNKNVLIWKEEHSCVSTKIGQSLPKTQDHVCDLSAINLQTPDQPINLNCSMMFTCGTILADTTDFNINTDKIYVGQGATIQNVQPSKAKNGANGANRGDSGANGADGTPAFNMTLNANKMLRESGKKLMFISQGGAGGDGGSGQPGKNNLDKIPQIPPDAPSVVAQGPLISNGYTKSCGSHCGGHCDCCDEYWHHAVIVNTNETCGDKGGKRGNGGSGGAAGMLNVDGAAGLEFVNTKLEFAGGAGGDGAVKAFAFGLRLNRRISGWRRYWEDPGCHGFMELSCGPSYHEAYGGYSYFNDDMPCPGLPGHHGKPGASWKP